MCVYLCTPVCLYVPVHVLIYTCVHVCTPTHIHMCTCVSVYMCVHVCTYVNQSVSTCVCVMYSYTHMYMCVHQPIYTCVHVWVCFCKCADVATSGILSQGPSILVFETVSHWPGLVRWVRIAGQWIPRDRPTPLALGLLSVHHLHSLIVGSRELDSGAYAFKACTLPTEPCPQPRLVSQQDDLKCKEAELPKSLAAQKVNTAPCSLTPKCGLQLESLSA